MYCLTIHVGQVAWTMLFKDEKKARESEAFLTNNYQGASIGLKGTTMTANGGHLAIADDFGQEAHILMPSLHGWMLEDLDQSKLAHIEKGIHNAHTQADYVKRAQTDPALRAGAQGPAIYAPGGNGLFRQ